MAQKKYYFLLFLGISIIFSVNHTLSFENEINIKTEYSKIDEIMMSGKFTEFHGLTRRLDIIKSIDENTLEIIIYEEVSYFGGLIVRHIKSPGIIKRVQKGEYFLETNLKAFGLFTITGKCEFFYNKLDDTSYHLKEIVNIHGPLFINWFVKSLSQPNHGPLVQKLKESLEQ